MRLWTAIVIATLVHVPARAHAQQDEIRDSLAEAALIEEYDAARLALALAQVCANESSLFAGLPGDCALIWQTVRRRGGETHASRLAWLRAHSSCVLTDRPLTEREAGTNCRWTRTLTDSSTMPDGWPSHWSWERASQRWERMRALCAALVAGQRPRGGWPCSEDPDTWGGRMDAHRAQRAGMIPVSCEGVRNQGYRFARRQRGTL